MGTGHGEQGPLWEQVPAAIRPAVARHLELLARWNRRVDLVAPARAEVWLVRHVIDSIELARTLAPGGRTLVDVGSGAGFPGVEARLLRPDLSVTLLEPTGRKAAFLRTLLRDLGLPGIEVETCRVQDLEGKRTFDHVVSRAVFPYPGWLGIGRRLLSGRDARLYALLGPKDPEGLGQEAEHGLRLLGERAFALPDGSRRRIRVLALGEGP